MHMHVLWPSKAVADTSSMQMQAQHAYVQLLRKKSPGSNAGMHSCCWLRMLCCATPAGPFRAMLLPAGAVMLCGRSTTSGSLMHAPYIVLAGSQSPHLRGACFCIHLLVIAPQERLDQPFFVWGEDALLKWPGAVTPLIEERDAYMARVIAAAAQGSNPNVPAYIADQVSAVKACGGLDCMRTDNGVAKLPLYRAHVPSVHSLHVAAAPSACWWLAQILYSAAWLSRHSSQKVLRVQDRARNTAHNSLCE
jgi:hypothetical protein